MPPRIVATRPNAATPSANGGSANACRGVTIVHHTVAQVPLAKDRHLFESVNIQGTENLLEGARAAGVRKVIYTSSSAVFGAPRSNPVS